jgi:hypothetical protein
MKFNYKSIFYLGLLAAIFIIAIIYFNNIHFFNLSFGVAHAQQDLHADLVSPGTDGSAWLFTVWRMMLGIANVFVVIILLFLAVVNIAHLSYDTYAIKKTLPLLIGGIIAANFSILICRMIVDAAQVLTVTFASDTKELAFGYLCSFRINSAGEWDIGALFNVMSLIVLILFGLLSLIAILILAFLLWIRKTVIFLLTAVSPIAFILYAFPPTQGLFKQWWSQFLKWVFMGPIFMAIIWVASIIGRSNCTGDFNVGVVFTVCGLTFLASIVPFKLGGAVMSGWSNFGKKATGTGKDGYLRKPVDAAIQRKKDRASSAMMNKFAGTKLGKIMDTARAKDENAIENNKGLRESKYQTRMGEHMERNKDRQKVIDREIEQGKNTIENLRMKLKLELESGDLGNISDKALASITGQKGATQATTLARYEQQNSDMNDYKNALEKERAEKLVLGSNEKIKQNRYVRKGLEQMATKVKSEYDKEGNKLAPGTTVDMDWHEAMDTAEQIDFDATKLKGAARQKKLDAANHIRNQANAYRATNKTYATGTTINGVSVEGQAIEYDDYLTRNLGGRQMKTEAPFIADEGKTLNMSTDYKTLTFETSAYERDASGKYKLDAGGRKIKKTKPVSFGTGRFRSDDKRLNKALVGKSHDVDSGASVANQAQLRGMVLNIMSMDRGEVIAIESAQNLMHRVNEAEEDELGIPGTFVQKTTRAALDACTPESRDQVEADIASQAGYKSYKALKAKGPAAVDAASKNFDISKLDCSSTDVQAQQRKAYLESLKAQLLTNENLQLSDNPASVAAGKYEK